MKKILSIILVLSGILSMVACGRNETKYFTVKFHTKMSWFTISDKTVVQGESLAEVDEPAWVDHVFIGWSTLEDGTADDIVAFPYVPTSDAQLYAIYEHIDNPVTVYLITINFNKPLGFGRQYTIKIGGTISQPSTPTREGYAFVGWALNNNATFKDILIFPYLPIGHTTLNAIWQANS